MIYVHGRHYSVLPIINMCANRPGGVHLGNPASDEADERALRRLNEELALMNAPSVHGVVYAIGEMTAPAVRPLREAIGQI